MSEFHPVNSVCSVGSVTDFKEIRPVVDADAPALNGKVPIT